MCVLWIQISSLSPSSISISPSTPFVIRNLQVYQFIVPNPPLRQVPPWVIMHQKDDHRSTKCCFGLFWSPLCASVNPVSLPFCGPCNRFCSWCLRSSLLQLCWRAKAGFQHFSHSSSVVGPGDPVVFEGLWLWAKGRMMICSLLAGTLPWLSLWLFDAISSVDKSNM